MEYCVKWFNYSLWNNCLWRSSSSSSHSSSAPKLKLVVCLSFYSGPWNAWQVSLGMYVILWQGKFQSEWVPRIWAYNVSRSTFPFSQSLWDNYFDFQVSEFRFQWVIKYFTFGRVEKYMEKNELDLEKMW